MSNSKLGIGYGLESCTSEVHVSEPFALDGRIVTLIDTPGFDDTVKTEAEILRLIADFLSATYVPFFYPRRPLADSNMCRYESGRKLNGVIFLHRISDYRMGGIARKNFRLFKKLCGDDALKSVVIATNMWGDVTPEVGEKRENELSTNDLFFKPALEKGAKVVRHDNTLESAYKIIREIMGFPPAALSIQKELVDEHKTIEQTAAGQDLKVELEAQIKKQKEEMDGIRAEMNEIIADKDEKHQSELNDLSVSLSEVRNQLSAFESERNKLREENDSYRKDNEERTKKLLAAMEEKENQLRALEAHSSKQMETIQALQESLVSVEDQLRAQAEEKEKAHAHLKALADQHQQEVDRIREEFEKKLEAAARQEKEKQEERLQQAQQWGPRPILAQWANTQLQTPVPPRGRMPLTQLVALAVNHFLKV